MHILSDEFILEGTIMWLIYFSGHILCDEIISEGTIYVMNLF